MRWEYRYIFAADLPRYIADGWELCGPMKGAKYLGWHEDTVVVTKPLAPSGEMWEDKGSNMPGVRAWWQTRKLYPRRKFGGEPARTVEVRVIPHPSGINRWWNCAENQRKAKQELGKIARSVWR